MSPVRVLCPGCQSPCLIAEQHLGVPVRCGRCGKTFTARPAASAAVRLEIGVATSPGKARDRNEDSYLVQHLSWSNLAERHEVALLIVADGMGGYDAGHVASSLLIRAAGVALAPLFRDALASQGPAPSADSLAAAVEHALQEAHKAVLQRARGDAACKGMGATAAVALIWDGVAQIGHVGDCRVWHRRGGQLTQVTRDQTLVARMIEQGRLTPQQAESHPARNLIEQAVGKQADLKPSRHALTLAPGDWLLLACDGLHTHVDEETLAEEMDLLDGSAPAVARRLVALADERGGSDNTTVIAVAAE
jgi:protein phosphatase